MLCFRWQGGAACASTSEAGALPASSTAIYKTPEDGPLPKHSQSLQSAKTPHSQPSLSPTHSKGTGGDTALATPAQVSAAQDKVGKKRFEPWRDHVRIEMLLFLLITSIFFWLSSQISATRGNVDLHFPQTKHETSAICHRPNTHMHVMRSKCIGHEYPCCVHVQFHQPRRSAQLWNRHNEQNQEKALYQSERHACHPWLP